MKRSDIHIYHRLLAVILTVLSVVSFHEAWGQVMPSAGRGSFITSNLNTGQGLSSSRAYSAIKSDDGAIWIFTKTGVDRYNGITVKNYSLPRQHQYSDASGMVIRLLKTTDDGIIAYDNKGHIYCYDTVTDRFILRHDLTAVLGGTMVLNEVCANGNVLWAALDRGACRIDDGGRAVLILKDHYVNHVAATSQGIIIGANDGLYLFRQLYAACEECQQERQPHPGHRHDAYHHRRAVVEHSLGMADIHRSAGMARLYGLELLP